MAIGDGYPNCKRDNLMFEIPPDSNTFDNDRIFDKELMKPLARPPSNSRGRNVCNWGEGMRSLRTPGRIF